HIKSYYRKEFDDINSLKGNDFQSAGCEKADSKGIVGPTAIRKPSVPAMLLASRERQRPEEGAIRISSFDIRIFLHLGLNFQARPEPIFCFFELCPIVSYK